MWKSTTNANRNHDKNVLDGSGSVATINTIEIKNKQFNFADHLFFSNYFYGICAVALSIEATVQQRYPLNGILYFFLVFMSTALYYTYPYLKIHDPNSKNPRTHWYAVYSKHMRWSQLIISVLLLLSCVLLFWTYGKNLLHMPLLSWVMIFIFPVVGAFYYGFDSVATLNLRNTGWPKPFIIGFTWAGLVTIYPVLFYDIVHQKTFQPGVITVLLFLKNLMFVTVLCIMFDIKDYAGDHINQLKTFIVRIGLRKTIFFLLLPLSINGLVTFVYYGITHNFSGMKLLLNIIPFILLMLTAYSLRKRRSLLYYLVVIDGLMLVKAICGTIAMVYF